MHIIPKIGPKLIIELNIRKSEIVWPSCDDSKQCGGVVTFGHWEVDVRGGKAGGPLCPAPPYARQKKSGQTCPQS